MVNWELCETMNTPRQLPPFWIDSIVKATIILLLLIFSYSYFARCMPVYYDYVIEQYYPSKGRPHPLDRISQSQRVKKTSLTKADVSKEVVKSLANLKSVKLIDRNVTSARNNRRFFSPFNSAITVHKVNLRMTCSYADLMSFIQYWSSHSKATIIWESLHYSSGGTDHQASISFIVA